MIDRLAESLRQAGIGFTVRELDDILWLASRLTGTPASAAQAQAAAPAPDTGGFADDAAPAAAGTAAQPPAETQDPADAGGAEVYADTGIEGSIRAGVLKVPGVAGSPPPSALRLALQPFSRRVASRRDMVLDEEATADDAAESGFWSPVFRPLRERCFALSLVIEDCTSASLRAHALAELATQMRQQGGLRSVEIYRITGGPDTRLVTEHGTGIGIDRLARDDRRHLLLFATDGASARWRSGAAQAFLHAASARASVAILHLLPRDAWQHTLVGEPDLVLHGTRAGDLNRYFRYELPYWIDAAHAAASLPVPVIGMDSADMARWARTVSARGGSGAPGVLVAPLRKEEKAAPAEPAQRPPVDEPGAEERVARFRQMASPAAFDLAVFLSLMDAMTIPIMRLVQRTMSRNGGDGELAEFILGGLVVPTRPGPAGDEQLYRFRPGVAAELFRALRYSEEHAIRRQLHRVGRYLEEDADQAEAIVSNFRTPEGQARIAEWALPFADVSRAALRRFSNPAAVVEPQMGDAAEPLSEVPEPAQGNAEDETPFEPHFVGRRQELQQLAARIPPADEAYGRPFRAMITGPARIGKTAMALMFVGTRWLDNTGRRLPHHHVSIRDLRGGHPKGALRALLEILQFKGNAAALAKHLQATSTLLILDDVDGPLELETLRYLIGRLPGCPMLCAGREWNRTQLSDAAGAMQMGWIELAELSREDSIALLAARNPTTRADHFTITRVADALFGQPAALAAAAAYLDNEYRTARLLNWLGVSDKAALSLRLLDDARRFAPLTRFMQDTVMARFARWAGVDTVPDKWKTVPLLLAHGPLAGSPLSLAAALADMRSLSDDPEKFSIRLDFLDATDEVGVRIIGNSVVMVPLWAMCLRAASPNDGPVVMRRWSDWIADRLALSNWTDERDWDELDRAQPALQEWFRICTPADAARVVEVCVPYARKRGPLPRWHAFCQRMLSLLAMDSPERGAWERTSEELVEPEDTGAVLEDIPEPFARPMALRPHQQRIAGLAQEATDAARGGRRDAPRHAGIVVQALGTGMTMSLLAYLELDAETRARRGRRHLIVVDRVELGTQIVEQYRGFVRMSDAQIFMPATTRELDTALEIAAPVIIVTTTQRLQQLGALVNEDCIVVLFGLRSVTKALMTRFRTATSIIFAYENVLLDKNFGKDHGPVIAHYLGDEAAEESLLTPLNIEQRRLGIASVRLPLALVQQVAEDIAENTRRPRTKAIVITKDATSAEQLRSALLRADVEHEDCVTAARFMSSEQLHQELVRFNRLEDTQAVLITTPANALGLYVEGVDICYVTTQVPAAAMFKLESFVNRPRPGKQYGTIVDLADNDWTVLKQVREWYRPDLA